MGILDGFLFWIGKALAEFAIAVLVLLFIGGIFGLMLWNQERSSKAWREKLAKRDGDSQP